MTETGMALVALTALLLDPHAAAVICGVSRSHLLALHSAGQVQLPVHLGRAVRWRREELRQWIAPGCPSRERRESIASVGQGSDGQGGGRP